MLSTRAAALLAAILIAALPAAPEFSYSQDFNSMGTKSAAPAGWKVFALAGSHNDFKPDDDTVGVGHLPTGDDIKGGKDDPMLIVATPDTTGEQRGKVGFNWGIDGSATERALGTSPSGASGMVLELQLTNSGAATRQLSIAYDVRVLSTTVPGNKGYDNSGYLGIEELPGYRLYYSLDDGATYTNVAELNENGHRWANKIGVVHEKITSLMLSGSWEPGAKLRLRWFDDNGQSPSPDQKLGLDNVVIKAVP